MKTHPLRAHRQNALTQARRRIGGSAAILPLHANASGVVTAFFDADFLVAAQERGWERTVLLQRVLRGADHILTVGRSPDEIELSWWARILRTRRDSSGRAIERRHGPFLVNARPPKGLVVAFPPTPRSRHSVDLLGLCGIHESQFAALIPRRFETLLSTEAMVGILWPGPAVSMGSEMEADGGGDDRLDDGPFDGGFTPVLPQDPLPGGLLSAAFAEV